MHLQCKIHWECVLCYCWQITCNICFENYPFEKMKAPRCGHYFCATCWTGQVLNAGIREFRGLNIEKYFIRHVHCSNRLLEQLLLLGLTLEAFWSDRGMIDWLVTGYMHTAINDGPGCLTLRCADPSCGATIGESMVLDLVSAEDREKYIRYLLRSYVEDNRKVSMPVHSLWLLLLPLSRSQSFSIQLVSFSQQSRVV